MILTGPSTVEPRKNSAKLKKEHKWQNIHNKNNILSLVIHTHSMETMIQSPSLRGTIKPPAPSTIR